MGPTLSRLGRPLPLSRSSARLIISEAPPAAVLIKRALNLESGSGRPNRDKVATITRAQLEEIAKMKMPDLNAASVEAAMSMIAGTCRSMGVVVAD